jgi:hypothetical protein
LVNPPLQLSENAASSAVSLSLIAVSPRPPSRYILVFKDNEFVLVFGVTVLLMRGEYGKSDVVSLDDFGHKLVIILGIAVISCVVKIHGLLDLEDGRLADD